ncbi:kinase-like protein [Punctularia strigosozonata HHB-11173 SS5]|uniref:Kinase-like protein n=1 Tax=Punctularia strigosozonata (strain HHB-11173) TaxID=741275 RepID=R7S307_PUNST|nr:kinase-like protein [Punctularia strigosozonata HHB-11173 SS5]EIN03641.1 kinase-like protein [Punctularia strigosozonata HHB-11173 SS5]
MRVRTTHCSEFVEHVTHSEPIQVFCQEAVYWKRLVHPHIVPFLGVDPQRPACIVSAWMDHGDVMTYISRYPSADRRQLVLDMAHGLEYMHKGNLIHGDIKSGNLLVDGSGRARLSDFGLATTALSTTSIALTAGSSANWGTVLYMAPELLDLSVKSKTLTKESDVYAFGMTAWEIFEGTQPFPDIQNIYEVLHNVVQGKRPSRPVRAEELGLDSFIWATAIESCWETEPSRRPQISEVIEWLVCYKIAREVVPRVLDGGLSDADRDMLNKLQATGESRHYAYLLLAKD